MSPKFLSRLWRQCIQLQRVAASEPGDGVSASASGSASGTGDFWMYPSNQQPGVPRNALIGLLVARGQNIRKLSDAERDLLVSRLGLFCTLFSLALCTLHDDEFLGNLQLDPHLSAQIPIIVGKGRVVSFHPQNANNAGSQAETDTDAPSTPQVKTMPFTIEELLHMIRILLSVSSSLLDLSLPYQPYLSSQSTTPSSSFDIQWRYLFLVLKIILILYKLNFYIEYILTTRCLIFSLCVKCVIRLLRQLHLRYTRRPFGPSDLWLSAAYVDSMRALATRIGQLYQSFSDRENLFRVSLFSTRPHRHRTLITSGPNAQVPEMGFGREMQMQTDTPQMQIPLVDMDPGALAQPSLMHFESSSGVDLPSASSRSRSPREPNGFEINLDVRGRGSGRIGLAAQHPIPGRGSQKPAARATVATLSVADTRLLTTLIELPFSVPFSERVAVCCLLTAYKILHNIFLISDLLASLIDIFYFHFVLLCMFTSIHTYK